jgi:hypothetical protein
MCQLEGENRRLTERCDALSNELSTFKRGQQRDIDVMRRLEAIETENRGLRHELDYVTNDAGNETASDDAIPTTGRDHRLPQISKKAFNIEN